VELFAAVGRSRSLPNAQARHGTGLFGLQGDRRVLALPLKFSRTPGKVRSGAPIFGEHTAEVLHDCGFDADEIAALEKEGAISAASP
jgi:crotonobetainyl-CoA:carnitine CoA-transferase CaiB-like acyl-CoA transferase